MAVKRSAVVTGAMSYIGSGAARSLLSRGWSVRTLSNRRIPLDPTHAEIPAAPLQFVDRRALVDFLVGAEVLVNTYWVRYAYHGADFNQAVDNSANLFGVAREAGVRRVVHVSVSNASFDSPLPYYSGKARVEQLLEASGLEHTIVRPTLVVGEQDILLNNIAWFLRRFPVFAMPGDGSYRVQPVTLEDTGEIIADAAEGRTATVVDAAGPEVLTFEELVRAVGTAVGRPARVLHLPPSVALALVRVVGWAMGDVILTKEELDGLISERLVSGHRPLGSTGFSSWLSAHGAALGTRFRSEWRRHFKGLPTT